MKRNLIAACLFISFAGVLIAEDWPQWRGIERSGISPETNLMETWPEGGPPLVWLYEKGGPGYAGPAVVGDRIYIMIARKGKTRLAALDAKTAEEVWTAEIGEIFRNDWGDGPRGTPTVDGDRVYAMDADGNLICAQTKTGEILWKVSMVDDLGGSIPYWGFSESVLVEGKHVLCTPGGDKGAIAALDKMTGELVWQTEELTETAHYSSIIPAKFAALPHLVQLTQENVVGISPSDGSTLWSVPWPGRTAVIPTPIVTEGAVYVTSGYGSGCKFIQLKSAGDKIEATEAYASATMKNHHGGVVLVDGHIYGYSDDVGWLCQELATGKEVWSEREKLEKGAVAFADGHLYCLSEATGDVVLVKASTEGWKEKGRFTLTPQTTHRKRQGRIWTHPVISNGRLYLRDQEYVYCFDISQK